MTNRFLFILCQKKGCMAPPASWWQMRATRSSQQQDAFHLLAPSWCNFSNGIGVGKLLPKKICPVSLEELGPMQKCMCTCSLVTGTRLMKLALTETKILRNVSTKLEPWREVDLRTHVDAEHPCLQMLQVPDHCYLRHVCRVKTRLSVKVMS